MNLSYYKQGISFALRENRVNVLVIENSDVLVDVVQDLYAQKEGREGGLVLAEGEKIYPFQKNLI